jgi:muconolactone delta-isomerase
MRFLVDGTLKHAHTTETMALIPAEIARGAELDRTGVRAMLYVAADFSEAWQIYNTASEGDLRAVLATFPLAPFLDYRIVALAAPHEVALAAA